MLSDTVHPKADSCKYISMRRAVLVALDSIQSKMVTLTGDCSRLWRSQLLLQDAVYNGEQIVIQSVFDMNSEAQVDFVFEIFDRQAKGFIDIIALSEGIQILFNFDEDKQAMQVAEHVVQNFDSNKDRCLDRQDFSSVCFHLAYRMNCDLPDLTHLVMCKMAFSPTGNDILNDVIARRHGSHEHHDAFSAEKNRISARTQLLFDMLVVERFRTVSYNDLIAHLDRFDLISPSLRREIHLALQGFGEEQRNLRFDEFEQVVLQISEIFPKHVDIDDIINGITLSALLPQEISTCDKTGSKCLQTEQMSQRPLHSARKMGEKGGSMRWGRNLFAMKQKFVADIA